MSGTTGGDDAAWQQLGETSFVALTTFRRSGAAVITPVWVAVQGDALVVTSETSTGKVKRLRRAGKVLLQRCGRLGRTDSADPVVEAYGAVLGPNEQHPDAVGALRRKYGLQYGAVLAVERLDRGLQRKPADRVILRIERRGSDASPRDAGTSAGEAEPSGGS